MNFVYLEEGKTVFSIKKCFIAGWGTESGREDGAIFLICRPDGEVLMPLGATLGFPGWLQSDCPLLNWPRLFIGTLDGQPVYLIAAARETSAPRHSEWVNIRNILGELEEGTLQAMCRASMLASWNNDHLFCGRCGDSMLLDADEAVRVCPACNFRSYPTISPVVIVRVVDGEKILLAHNRRFPGDRYSCVAGYVDAGETLESAIIREVMEEVGLKAAAPRYIGSQAWPFPHSLMIGFEATARGEPVPDGREITDAQWFTPDVLPQLPPRGSIARALIDGWLASIGRQNPKEGVDT